MNAPDGTRIVEQWAEVYQRVSIIDRDSDAAGFTRLIEELSRAESEIGRLKASADFLRKSVGVCHLMISRNNIDELKADEWQDTDLPPRLEKFIAKRDAEKDQIIVDLQTKNQKLRKALQDAEIALVNCIPVVPYRGNGPLVKLRAVLAETEEK